MIPYDTSPSEIYIKKKQEQNSSKSIDNLAYSIMVKKKENIVSKNFKETT